MEKKDILVVVCCVVLLFLWFAKNPPSPPPPQMPAEEQSITPARVNENTAPLNESGENLQTALPDTSGALPAFQAAVAEDAIMHSEFAALKPAKPVTLIVPELAEYIIDPEAGGISMIILNQYKEEDGHEYMHLGHPGFSMLNVQNRDESWKFSHARIDAHSDDHLTVSRAIIGTPFIITQTWQLDPQTPFEIDYTVSLQNWGQVNDKVEEFQIDCGVMKPLSTAKGFMGAGGIDQRVDILISGKNSPKTINLDKISDYSEKDRQGLEQERLDWIAVQNKYFASIISGEKPIAGCDLTTVPLDPDNSKSELLRGIAFLPSVSLKAGETKQWKFNCFLGPKKYDLLKKTGQHKDSILQFDLFMFFHFKWMKLISLGIFRGMLKLESIFHNYGIAIIVITLIIRTMFWPITHKSTVWSKRMQKIQPLAQEVREKYKSDPQKMQQKTMELYREHKINPVAGCLPMFLQIPVFFALFNVFRSAIELRQAGFLWAADLSRQDSVFIIPGIDIPINPLAILMGLTMFLQQRTMPSSPDPMQQKVMMFMTVFFVFMLYTMPSGLTLYWTINQVISIFQYKITRQIGDKEPKKKDKQKE